MKLEGYLLTAFLLVFARAAGADECLQEPFSTTDLPAPPAWFKPPASSPLVYKELLQDPRWSGAQLRAFPQSADGTTANLDDAMVRLMEYVVPPSGSDPGTSRVYFSFQARADDNVGTQDNSDGAYLGFTEGTGTNADIIQVIPDWTSPQPKTSTKPHDSLAPVPVDPGYIFWFSSSSPPTNWGLNPKPPGTLRVPTWLHDVATWRSSPGAKWAITFWIDLKDSSLHVTGAMKMFWGMQIHDSAGSVLFGSNPPNLTPNPTQNDTLVPDSPANWTQMDAVGTPCTQGATLDPSDIGVWDGTTLSSNVCASGATCAGTNDFRAIARNVFPPPGQTVDDYALRVKLKVAEWGSTIADPSSAAWKDIPFSVPNTSLIASARTTTLVAGGWVWADDCTGVATTDYTCRMGSGDTYCPKLSDPADTGTLLFAELVQPGNTYEISEPAALRTMTYTGLSSITAPATISLEGLGKGAGFRAERDVYLFTDDSNLPRPGNEAIKLDGKAMAYVRAFAEKPPVLGQNAGRKTPQCRQLEHQPPASGVQIDKASQGKLKGRVGKAIAHPTIIADDDPLQRLIKNPVALGEGFDSSSLLAMRREQALDQVWPTRRVRVYYDTGKTFTSRGTVNKVLQPMVPFGYRFSHDGALYGFKTSLDGLNGSRVEKISENMSVMKIRDGESAKIVQSISAEEKPLTHVEPQPPPPKCPECKVEPGSHCNCTVPGRLRGAASAVMGAAALGLALGLWRRARRRNSDRRDG